MGASAVNADGTPVRVEPPVPPVPPEPPIDKKIEQAPKAEAAALVKKLDPTQKQQLQTNFDAKTPVEKQAFAENLAGKLDGQDLSTVRATLKGPGDAEVIDQAVAATAPPPVKLEYQQTNAGLKADAPAKLGISREAIGEITKPIADRLNGIATAAASQNMGEVTKQIEQLGKDAPKLAGQVLTNIVDKAPVPQAVKNFVKNNPTLVEETVKAAPGAIGDLIDGNLGKAVVDMASNPDLRNAVITAVTATAPVQKALEVMGIGVDKIKSFGADGAALLNAAIQGADGKWLDAAKSAAGIIGNSPVGQAAADVLAKIAPKIEGLSTSIQGVLQDPTLKAALLGAGKDAAIELINGHPEKALEKITDPKLAEAVFDSFVKQPQIKALLDKTGITAESLKESKEALPELATALAKFDANDMPGAMEALIGAVKKGAPVAADLLAKFGDKLIPGNNKASQLLKGIIGDTDLMKELIGNQEAHDAVAQMLGGDVTKGLAALGKNDAAMTALAKHIQEAKDPATVAMRERLASLGFKTADQLKQIGPAVAGVAELDEIMQGQPPDIGKALVKLGEIGRAVPPEVRTTVMDKMLAPIVKHLPKLSPALQEVVKQTAIGLTDPAVADKFANAIKSLPANPGAFISGMGETLKALSENKEVSLAVLNALGRIGDGKPQKNGNLGAFFADPEFNKALVDSGGVNAFIEGATDILVNRDLAGGMQKMSSIMTSLLGSGDPIKIGGGEVLGIGLPSYELPFVKSEGFNNISKLFQRINDALPASAREKIASAVTNAAEKVVSRSLPWTAVTGLIGDVKDTVSTWNENSTLENVLNVANIVADAGNLIPGAGKLAAGLNFIIGVGKGLIDASEAVQTGVDLADAVGVI